MFGQRFNLSRFTRFLGGPAEPKKFWWGDRNLFLGLGPRDLVRKQTEKVRPRECLVLRDKVGGGGVSKDQKHKPVPTKSDFFSNYIGPF